MDDKPQGDKTATTSATTRSARLNPDVAGAQVALAHTYIILITNQSCHLADPVMFHTKKYT